jgi:hypothetical protein
VHAELAVELGTGRCVLRRRPLRRLLHGRRSRVSWPVEFECRAGGVLVHHPATQLSFETSFVTS